MIPLNTNGCFLLLTIIFFAVNTCLSNAPSLNQRISNNRERISNLKAEVNNDNEVLAAILDDYAFTCSGVISQWSIEWEANNLNEEQCSITFSFYVVRQTNRDECRFDSLRRNTLTVTATDTGIQESVLDVLSENRLTVQAGDTVGITVELSQNCHHRTEVFIVGLDTARADVFYNEEIRFDSLLGRFLECINFQRDEVDAPLINAVVGKL